MQPTSVVSSLVKKETRKPAGIHQHGDQVVLALGGLGELGERRHSRLDRRKLAALLAQRERLVEHLPMERLAHERVLEKLASLIERRRCAIVR